MDLRWNKFHLLYVAHRVYLTIKGDLTCAESFCGCIATPKTKKKKLPVSSVHMVFNINCGSSIKKIPLNGSGRIIRCSTQLSYNWCSLYSRLISIKELIIDFSVCVHWAAVNGDTVNVFTMMLQCIELLVREARRVGSALLVGTEPIRLEDKADHLHSRLLFFFFFLKIKCKARHRSVMNIH